MFRGSCPTRLDEKGRLKMPADFKHEIDRSYDGKFYITSIDGAVIQLYPLKEWEAVEERAASQPISNKVVQKFLGTTSYYGQEAEMDSQGRLTIAERLREKFGLEGEVAVVGKLKHLEIRVLEDFSRDVENNPLTTEEMDELMRMGI
jgi:MraZ protein